MQRRESALQQGGVSEGGQLTKRKKRREVIPMWIPVFVGLRSSQLLSFWFYRLIFFGYLLVG